MIQSNISYLAPLIVDPEHLLAGNKSGAVEVTKRILDLFDILREDPTRVQVSDYERIVKAEGSQIGRPDPHVAHCINVARLNQDLNARLQDRHPDLALPSPEEAFAYGLVHDLAATFALYQNGGPKQESKELPQYLIAKEAGLSIAFDPKDKELEKVANVIIKNKDLKEVLKYIL